MEHTAKVLRWLEEHNKCSTVERIGQALAESSGRRRQMTYQYKGKNLGTVTVCDSWYSKMSRLSKQLTSVGHVVPPPEWIVFFTSFEEPSVDDACEAIERGWLSYQFTIVPRTLDPSEGVDSWH